MSDEMERQELGTPAGGVGEAGTTGQAAHELPAVEPQPTTGAEATTAGGAQPERVNLDELPEFRQWKSNRDREAAELQRQLKEQQARLQELEAAAQQAEELRLLQDAEPDQIVAYYQGQLAKTRQQAAQQAQQAAQHQEIVTRANATLTALGLDPLTPGLDWTGGPTLQGYAQLLESAVGLLTQQQRQTSQTVQEKAEKAAREARQAAIAETGATKVSTTTGSAPAGLRDQYERDVAALRGTGDGAGLLALKRAYRKKGLDV